MPCAREGAGGAQEAQAAGVTGPLEAVVISRRAKRSRRSDFRCTTARSMKAVSDCARASRALLTRNLTRNPQAEAADNNKTASIRRPFFHVGRLYVAHIGRAPRGRAATPRCQAVRSTARSRHQRSCYFRNRYASSNSVFIWITSLRSAGLLKSRPSVASSV